MESRREGETRCPTCGAELPAEVQLVVTGTLSKEIMRDITAGGPCPQCGSAYLHVISHHDDVAPGGSYNVHIECAEEWCSTPLGRRVYTRPKG